MKKDDYNKLLFMLLADQTKINELEKYLLSNTNLPGPAVNLSLSYAFADCIENIELKDYHILLLIKWLNVSKKIDVNNPEIFLPICAIQSLGAIYKNSDKKEEIINKLKLFSNDDRWRLRESVAFAFQRIAEKNFNIVKDIFSIWINNANLKEQRAMLVSLAHPPILKDRDNVIYSLKLSDIILNNIINLTKDEKMTEDFRILKKGLSFTLSVFIQNLPEEGFIFLKKWANKKDKDIISIIKSNLSKSRLTKKFSKQVKEILSFLK